MSLTIAESIFRGMGSKGDHRPSIYNPWIIFVHGGARSGEGTHKP